MCEQSTTLGHVIQRFNEMHKTFIVVNLAIERWPVIYANDFFNELLERKRGEVIGKFISDCELWLAYEKTLDNQTEKWNQLKLHIKERKEFQFQALIQKSSGKHINCRLHCTPIKNTELIVIIFEIKDDQERKRRKSRINLLGNSKLNLTSLSLSDNRKKNLLLPNFNSKGDSINPSKDQSERKQSILSQLFLFKNKSKDGASISRSKSLENTTGLIAKNKQVLTLIKDKNSSGNLDHLTNLAISKDKFENELNKDDQLNEHQKYQLKNSQQIENLDINQSKLRPKKFKKQKHFIKKRTMIPSSKSMTNDLRSLHLHIIEKELKDKLNNNQMLNNVRFIEQKDKIHDYKIQKIKNRRQSASGEILKYSFLPIKDKNNDNQLTIDENDFDNNEIISLSKNDKNDISASSHSIHLQTTSNTSIDFKINMNDNQSIKSKLSTNSIKSTNKNSLSKSSLESNLSKSKTSSSSSISPFKLPFGIFTNRIDDKRSSFSSMDSDAKHILKGVQNKLTTNLSNKVAQIEFVK